MTIKDVERILEKLPSDLVIDSFKAESKQLKAVFTITMCEYNTYEEVI